MKTGSDRRLVVQKSNYYCFYRVLCTKLVLKRNEAPGPLAEVETRGYVDDLIRG